MRGVIGLMGTVIMVSVGVTVANDIKTVSRKLEPEFRAIGSGLVLGVAL